MFETYKPTTSTYSSSEIHTRNARKGFAFHFRMEMRALRIKHGRKKERNTQSEQKPKKTKIAMDSFTIQMRITTSKYFLVVTKLKTD